MQESLGGAIFNVESTSLTGRLLGGYFTVMFCLMIGAGMKIGAEKCVGRQFFHVNIIACTYPNLDGIAHYCNFMCYIFMTGRQ